MAKEIDEKVVSMKFDNKHFMEHTSETMSRLDKLKNSLRLPGISKGLEEVGNAANGIKLNPLGAAAEQVSLKFNALQVMATTALMNITNSAVNAGKRIVAAFTIDPIKTGLQEYETQINAVQTILANTSSKGTTLDQVNNALDELNRYADMTIYNFTEMTRNIGTFTAAGVDLDTSVSAIKGIANLAAVSGSTSQQASTAMYQLSQALASGTVKLMDWNSVVNAGMGGQVFQDALKETARVDGIAIDDMIEKHGSFRETLQEGWLTSEVLTKTLAKFTGDLSEEQLKQMGYSEEQIKEIIKLGQTANDAATKVKTFTQLMDTLKEAAQSGWTQTWEILIGDFEEAKKLWTSVSDYFSDALNKSAEARNNMLKAWADAGGREMVIETFKNTFQGLLSIIKPIKEAFREIFPRKTADDLLKITEAIKKFTSKLILNEKAQDKLKSTFKGLFAVIDIGVTAVKEITKGAVKLISNFSGLVKGVLGVSGSFGDWISNIRDTVKETNIFGVIIGGIVNILQKFIDKIKIVISFLKEKFITPGFEGFLKLMSKLWEVVKYVADKVWQVISTLGQGILDAFRNGDFKSAMDVFNGGIIAAILLNLKKFVKNFTGSLGGITEVAGNITGILDAVKGCFEAWQQSIQAKTLMTIAKAIAILAISILVIASIDSGKLAASLGTITALFAELMGAMAIYAKFAGPVKGVVSAITAMLGMSVAVLILASALKKISGIDSQDMITGILGIAALTTILVSVAKIMAKNEKIVIKGAGKMIAMAIALDLLAIAIKMLGGMKTENLAKGIGGVMALLYGMVGALALMSKFWATGTASLIAMAFALNLLIVPIAIIGRMNLVNIAKGVGALVVAIYALVGAAALMNGLIVGAAGLLVLSAALVGFAIGMTMLIPTLVAFALLDIGKVCVGLLELAGTLVVLGMASIISPLLMLLGVSLKTLGAGLLALAPGLAALTLLDFAGVFSSLLKLAGVLVLLSIAAVVSPLLILLGAALTLLGVGALLAGPGLLALSAGITAFAAALSGSLNIIISGITSIITSIIGLIPSIIKAIGDGIILIAKTIAGSVSTITSAIVAVIVALCDAIIQSVPKIVKAAGVLLDALLKFIVEYAPKLISAGIKLILALLDGIAQNIDKVIEKGVLVVTKFLEGINSQLSVVIAAAFDFILDFINGIGDAIETYTPQLMEACVNLGMSIVKGVVKGMVNIPGAIWNGIVSVGNTIKNGFMSLFNMHSPSKVTEEYGKYLDEGLAIGLTKYKDTVGAATEDVGTTAVNSMSNAISGISDAIDSDIDSQPTIRPVLDLSDIRAGAGSINDMFGMTPSVDVLSNVGSINSMMNKNQNGGNSDVISAINKLGKQIQGNQGNVYNVNGVTYDDGSNVADAVVSLVRAAKIERRI